mmetsp:Transcript_17297/g.15271  ORF Transcript_17297/g.15271 Transcript_17297/m.15271 type:complete len:104 (-) Transcript_17297:119-430(-)
MSWEKVKIEYSTETEPLGPIAMHSMTSHTTKFRNQTEHTIYLFGGKTPDGKSLNKLYQINPVSKKISKGKTSVLKNSFLVTNITPGYFLSEYEWPLERHQHCA